jgi:hypothetical protein
MSKKSVVKLSVRDGQSKEEALAEFWLSPSTMGASVIDAYKKNVQGDELSFEMALDVLKNNTKSINAGEVEKIEAMLMCQANALEVMFSYLARKALAQQYFNQYQANIQLALKAQNQCRTTLQTLIQLKQPNQTAFIKQANIANGNQQVNNNFITSENLQNKLLDKEVFNASKEVDCGTKIKAI